MALIGRYFVGVVASQELSPESTQDAARVNVSRARIAVADGAGDSGGTAGDWALLLALSYAAAFADDDGRASWLERAVATWRGASNMDGFLRAGLILKPNELKLLRKGVDAAFAGGTFRDQGDGVVVSWQAAGDCEVMLFREGRLVNWGPLKVAADFTSVVRGLNSADPERLRLQSDTWQLMADDTLLLSTDAVARWILGSVTADYATTPEIAALLECRSWDGLRGVISRNRNGGGLEPDDVAIVRVRIEEMAIGTGFHLVEEGTAIHNAALQTEAWPQAVAPTARPQELPELIAGNGTLRQTPSVPTTHNSVEPARISLHAVYGVIASAALILGIAVGQQIGTRERLGAVNPSSATPAKPALSHGAATASSVSPNLSDTATHPIHDEVARSAEVMPTVHATQRQSAPLSEQHVSKAGTRSKDAVRRHGDQANSERPRSEHLTEAARVPDGIASKKSERSNQDADSRIANTEIAKAKVTSPEVAKVEEPKAAQGSESVTATQNASTSAPPTVASEGSLTTRTSAPIVTSAPPRESLGAVAPTAAAPPALTTERQVTDPSVSTKPSNTQSPVVPEQRLVQGTRLYGVPKKETWPVLKIEAKTSTCIVKEDGTAADLVTIRAWVRAASISGDKFSAPTKAWTAPIGVSGSEFLGSFRAQTPFHKRDKKHMGNAVWTEVEVTAYRLK